jgi:hypothetical protein
MHEVSSNAQADVWSKVRAASGADFPDAYIVSLQSIDSPWVGLTASPCNLIE